MYGNEGVSPRKRNLAHTVTGAILSDSKEFGISKEIGEIVEPKKNAHSAEWVTWDDDDDSVLIFAYFFRKLKICHFKKGTEICNYSYSNTILAVKLNRLRLIVCLEESLYVHNIRDMKVLHTIRDTPPNPQGLCALSVSNDNCFLAYPGSSQVCHVTIGHFDGEDGARPPHAPLSFI